MSIKIAVKGVRDTMLGVREKVSEEMREELLGIGKELVERLKRVTPVDTGEARDGWRTTYLDENWVTEDLKIVNPVEHIAELNEGTSTQAPSRFIEKTVLAHRDVSPSGIIVRRK